MVMMMTTTSKNSAEFHLLFHDFELAVMSLDLDVLESDSSYPSFDFGAVRELGHETRQFDTFVERLGRAHIGSKNSATSFLQDAKDFRKRLLMIWSVTVS